MFLGTNSGVATVGIRSWQIVAYLDCERRDLSSWQPIFDSWRYPRSYGMQDLDPYHGKTSDGIFGVTDHGKTPDSILVSRVTARPQMVSLVSRTMARPRVKTSDHTRQARNCHPPGGHLKVSLITTLLAVQVGGPTRPRYVLSYF